MAAGKPSRGPDGRSGGQNRPRQEWHDPRQRVAADRMLQHEISDALESLADTLPDLVDYRLGRALLAVIEPCWTEHTSFQDEALFPILLRRHAGSDKLSVHVERFRREHVEIGSRHEEVIEQIELLITERIANTDAFGYLLRNVFDSRRRHMEAETAVLDPLLPNLLAPADRLALSEWSAARHKPPFPISLLLGIRD